MSDLYDPREYLRTQQQETYRACIVHAPAMRGKTAWGRRLRDQLGACLLDLQRYFADRPEIMKEIDLFEPEDLERMLLQLEIPETTVVIDNMDFLLNMWTPAAQDHFLGIVERRFKSPGVTDKVFVFLVQDHPYLLRRSITNSHGQARVVPLQQFAAL